MYYGSHGELYTNNYYGTFPEFMHHKEMIETKHCSQIKHLLSV